MKCDEEKQGRIRRTSCAGADSGVGKGAGGIVGRSFALLEGCKADAQIQGIWSRALNAVRHELCGHLEGQRSRQKGQSTQPVERSRNSKKVWALEQSELGEGACMMGVERIPLALCGEDTMGRKGNIFMCLVSLRRQESRLIRCGGEVSNSRCVHILKVEQAEFANDLNIGYGRKE